VLLIEQKLTIAMAISDRALVMGHGSIVFQGTPEVCGPMTTFAKNGWRSDRLNCLSRDSFVELRQMRVLRCNYCAIALQCKKIERPFFFNFLEEQPHDG
jgi:energy-coupling factor transporter ATP-binding protein EcfA2